MPNRLLGTISEDEIDNSRRRDAGVRQTVQRCTGIGTHAGETSCEQNGKRERERERVCHSLSDAGKCVPSLASCRQFAVNRCQLDIVVRARAVRVRVSASRERCHSLSVRLVKCCCVCVRVFSITVFYTKSLIIQRLVCLILKDKRSHWTTQSRINSASKKVT